MPAFALLFKVVMGNMYALYLALTHAKMAVRLAAVGIMAGAYVACALAFSLFIAPMIANLFTTSYGQFLGLAFPPISGSVVAGLVGLWGCIMLKNYYLKVIKLGLN